MEDKTSSEAIGLRIKELREKNGETQNDLATAISCNQNNISKIEKGGSLTVENLIAIANHYNVSLDYLCKGEGGIDLLDTLNKYIKYTLNISSSLNIGSKYVAIPHININSSFYKYLRQISLANKDSEMPDNVRNIWIANAIDDFNKEIDTDNYKDYVSFLLVNESLLPDNSELAAQLEILISE